MLAMHAATAMMMTVVVLSANELAQLTQIINVYYLFLTNAYIEYVSACAFGVYQLINFFVS